VPALWHAVSDLEVKHEEVAGKLYEIRYPVVGRTIHYGGDHASGDHAGRYRVAVNEKDDRYRHLHGRKSGCR